MSKRKASTVLSPQGLVKLQRRQMGARRPQHANLAILRMPASPEVKTAFAKITNAVVSSGGNALDVFAGMTQGTGMRNQFLGRRFEPIGVEIRYFLECQGNMLTNSRNNTQVRCTLLQWEDTYAVGTPPSYTGIYEDVTTVSSGFELVNWENIDVLHDGLHAMQTVCQLSATVMVQNSIVVKKYIKGNKLKPVLFNDVSNAWQKGGIVFVFYSDAAAAATPTVTLNGWIRVFFRDA